MQLFKIKAIILSFRSYRSHADPSLQPQDFSIRHSNIHPSQNYITRREMPSRSDWILRGGLGIRQKISSIMPFSASYWTWSGPWRRLAIEIGDEDPFCIRILVASPWCCRGAWPWSRTMPRGNILKRSELILSRFCWSFWQVTITTGFEWDCLMWFKWKIKTYSMGLMNKLV